MLEIDKIIVFTDGGVRGNQNDENIGAWAYTVLQDNKERSNYAVELNTTNNIQEMKACIEALKAIEVTDIPIEIHSDSAYVINGMGKTKGTGWIDSWKDNGWTRGKKKEDIMNLELWKELDELRCKFDSVIFFKVKGHSGNDGNEKVDKLVNMAMDEHIENNKL